MHNTYVLYQSPVTPALESAAAAALKYALLSLPFTVNRMALPHAERRLLNIVKGKWAEYVFLCWAHKQNLRPNTAVCSTPYWETDKRDFMLWEIEWDIKNNYIKSLPSALSLQQAAELPALVPNRFVGDQWDKAFHTLHFKSKKAGLLFTFMSRSHIPGLRMPTESLLLLQKAVLYFQNKQFSTPPLDEDVWLTKLLKPLDGKLSNAIAMPSQVQMLITAVAFEDQARLFSDASPGVWAGGELKTRIANKYALISQLPCFAALMKNQLG